MAALHHAKFSSVTSAAAVSTLTPDRQWRIVLARDRRYDGAFVYAVRSTGIYCRPSCASRRPRRGQVTFFPIPEAAEREGFRACRRCRPGDVSGGDPAIGLVREACRALDAPGAPPLSTLAQRLGQRPHGLLRAFKRVLGITPQQYRDARRVTRLKHELKRRPHVSPAVYEAGYGSSSRVYERAHAQLGMTPATYARGGAGAEIAFAVLPCSLGQLLVAATPRGSARIRRASKPRSRRSWPIWMGASPTSICRSTSAPPPFSGGCGKSCSAFPTARRVRTRTSPDASEAPRRVERWPERARRIQL